MFTFGVAASDPRLKFTIGGTIVGKQEGQFNSPSGMAFGSDCLFVVDRFNHRIQAFSLEDGSFISQIGSPGSNGGQFQRPYDVAIDTERSRIVVADVGNYRVQVLSLLDGSCVFEIDKCNYDAIEPLTVAIDHRRQRILMVDRYTDCVQVFSLIDGSFVFKFGGSGWRPGRLSRPGGLAVDHRLDRIVVVDGGNNRVQVFSSIDGSFEFEFGSAGTQPGMFASPWGVCIDHQSRIIVADAVNARLQAFTAQGHHISSLKLSIFVGNVAFDEHRGLIAVNRGNQVSVLGANQWLPGTFVWQPDRHCYAPAAIKAVVRTITMLRSLSGGTRHADALSLIPNELLFEIFSYL